VALLLADQRMPRMEWGDVSAGSEACFPNASERWLTAYADTKRSHSAPSNHATSIIFS